MTVTAKLFQNGASQAVRLPKEFRFVGDEVGIKQVGSAVLLFPKDAAWDLMAQAIDGFDDDFMAQRAQPTKVETRKALVKKKGKRA